MNTRSPFNRMSFLLLFWRRRKKATNKRTSLLDNNMEGKREARVNKWRHLHHKCASRSRIVESLRERGRRKEMGIQIERERGRGREWWRGKRGGELSHRRRVESERERKRKRERVCVSMREREEENYWCRWKESFNLMLGLQTGWRRLKEASSSLCPSLPVLQCPLSVSMSF